MNGRTKDKEERKSGKTKDTSKQIKEKKQFKKTKSDYSLIHIVENGWLKFPQKSFFMRMSRNAQKLHKTAINCATTTPFHWTNFKSPFHSLNTDDREKKKLCRDNLPNDNPPNDKNPIVCIINLWRL